MGSIMLIFQLCIFIWIHLWSAFACFTVKKKKKSFVYWPFIAVEKYRTELQNTEFWAVSLLETGRV